MLRMVRACPNHKLDITEECVGLFSTQHMQKCSSIRSVLGNPKCTVCSKAIENYHSVCCIRLVRLRLCVAHVSPQEPLKIALCPSGDCKAVSHLSCLAADFLSPNSQSVGLLPRGGTCKWCRSYVLWGDVVRGCYRRHQGGKTPQVEESDREEGDTEAEARSDDPKEDLIPEIPAVPAPAKAPRTRVARGETTKRPRGRPPKQLPSLEVEGAPTAIERDSANESFDIGGFTDMDDSESDVERRMKKPTPLRQRK